MRPDAAREVFSGRRIGVTVERWGAVEREVVDHPGAVAVVAVDREDMVTLVRQLRAPARRELLELPAGTLEPGEAPLVTARRELAEETGLHGGVWRAGPEFFTTPGFCRERMHLFFAEELDRGEPQPAADEEIEIVRWPVADVGDRLGELEDAKTIAGLLLYLRDSG